MECKFYSGQKVVCVHDENSAECLVQDQIYTVKEVVVIPGTIYLTLVEVGVPNYMSPAGRQPGWFHWRFRPLQETKTDISVFTKLLKTKKKVLEDA
jgi:hypothetical protein